MTEQNFRLENIRTSADGLKKIIDFLQGPENIYHIVADKPSDKMVFQIEGVVSVPLEMRTPPRFDYKVNIGMLTSIPDHEKHAVKLLDLIKEVYKI
jgi:hypothetical protein